jgi:hypothetical protein
MSPLNGYIIPKAAALGNNDHSPMAQTVWIGHHTKFIASLARIQISLS